MTVEWQSDLKQTDILKAGFKNTNWNVDPKPRKDIPWPPPIVNGEIVYTLPRDGKRQEVEPNHRTFPGNGTWFFAFSFRLDKDFPLDVNTWQLIWQLHGNDSTSPLFALQARNNQLRIGDSKVLAGLVTNRNYHVAIRCDFTNGRMQVWLDGKDLGTHNVGRSNPNYYLKVGYYRNPGIGRPGRMFQWGYKLGTEYQDVVYTTVSNPPVGSGGNDGLLLLDD